MVAAEVACRRTHQGGPRWSGRPPPSLAHEGRRGGSTSHANRSRYRWRRGERNPAGRAGTPWQAAAVYDTGAQFRHRQFMAVESAAVEDGLIHVCAESPDRNRKSTQERAGCQCRRISDCFNHSRCQHLLSSRTVGGAGADAPGHSTPRSVEPPVRCCTACLRRRLRPQDCTPVHCPKESFARSRSSNRSIGGEPGAQYWNGSKAGQRRRCAGFVRLEAGTARLDLVQADPARRRCPIRWWQRCCCRPHNAAATAAAALQ
jgi:hypothetical protein